MSTANITVTASEPVITVSNDLSNVAVTSNISNIVVGTTAFASNADIRSAISLTNTNGAPGLTYNSTTGVFTYSLYGLTGIAIDPNGAISTDSSVLRTGITVSGDAGVTGTLTATYLAGDGSNITGVSTLTNAQAKAYIESTGLDATANLNTTANASATYFIGDGSQLTGIDSNADVKAFIESNGLAMTSAITSNSNITTTANVNSASFNTTGNATVGANLNVSGDLEVTGNINYREVEDLLVQDQTITLNYGNASAQDAQIIVDRQGSGLANVDLKWNETADEWQFTNDGTVYSSIGGSNSFTEDNITLRSGETSSGNANIFVNTGTSVTGNATLGWRDFGNGNGVWQASHQTGNVVGGSGQMGNVVTVGGSNTFLQAADDVTFGLQNYNGNIGNGPVVVNGAPLNVYVRGIVYSNIITVYDDSDGVLSINDNGGNDDAIDINIALRTTNDAGSLNSGGMTIFGSQATTGPGIGNLRKIVEYDGMGNVSTYLDFAGNDNANTNTNHFTIHGNGDNDPVFKVNQNSDITIGGVITSDSNVTTTANVSGAYILGDGSQLTNLDHLTNAEVKTYIETNGLAMTSAITSDSNITTTANVSGSYILGNISQATGGNDLTNAQVKTYIETNGLDATANLTTTANVSADYVTATTEVSANSILATSLTGVKTPYIELNTISREAGSFSGAYIQAIGDEANTSVLPTIRMASAQPYQSVDGVRVLDNLSVGGNVKVSDVISVGSTFGSSGSVYLRGSNNQSVVNGLISNGPMELNNSVYGVDTILQINATSNTGNLFVTNGPGGNVSITGNANLTADGTVTADSGVITNLLRAKTSSDDIAVEQSFGSNATDTKIIEIDGDGYAIFQGSTFSSSARASYSGTTNLTYYEWEGTATSGSPTLTVTAMREGSADTAATVADLNLGYVLGTGNGNFPDDAYITSIDTGAGTVTFNKNAVVSGTLAYSDGKVFSPGAIDTDTGLVYELQSELQVNGSGSYTTLRYTLPTNIAYGYPQTGPVAGDFNTYAIGTASDYTFNNVSDFTVARTNITPANAVIKANDGITIGRNTDLSNRGENDVFRSFGLNMTWDGTETYATPPQPAVLFKGYTDNAQQGQPGFLDAGAPRLFFTTANGKSTDDPYSVYPRTGQELGRLSFWGSTGTQLTPSSYNVPSYMSVQAADDWSTWGGGPAGNTDVYFGSTSSASSGGNPDTYLAYKSGALFLGAGNNESITLLPAQQTSGTTPADAYSSSPTTWANVNYASGTAGAKFTVNNGGSVDAGVVGDMQLSLKRNDNSSSLSSNVGTILDGTYINSFFAGQVWLSITGDVGTSLNGLTGTFSAAGTITASASGNETALGGNSYTLNAMYPSGTPGNYLYRMDSGGVTYTSIGGTAGAFATQTGGATVSTVVSSGVTAKEWKINLAEQSNNLALQSEAVTKIEFTDNESIFSNRVRFQNLDTTAINALTGMAAGDTVYNTTETTLCFYDGSAWQKVDKTAL